MKIQINKKFKDFEYALALGLIIGVFILPGVNDFFSGSRLLYVDLVLLFGMPLFCMACLFFTKVLFGRSAGFLQFARFVLVGVANTAINLGIFNYFVNATGITRGFPLAIISSVAFFGSLVNSYIWNCHWSFREGFNNSVYQFERFFLVSFVGLLVYNSAVIMVISFSTFHGAPKLLDNIGELAGVLLALIWNFVGYKFIVFKNK